MQGYQGFGPKSLMDSQQKRLLYYLRSASFIICGGTPTLAAVPDKLPLSKRFMEKINRTPLYRTL